MALHDGDRVYPVDTLVVHHAVTPTWDNVDDQFLINWYSDNGKARIYQNGAINPNHNKPGSSELSYSQAHATIHPYTIDGNKYGWRWVWLIDDPWNNVSWGAANWPINQRCINVEICGNYSDHQVDEKALMLIADVMRGQDQSLNGGLTVFGHCQVSQLGTACPCQVLGQIPSLIDMINSQAAWNDRLWPAPAPQPAPEPTPAAAPAPVPAIKYERLKGATGQPIVMHLSANKQPTDVFDFTTGQSVKQLDQGNPFDAVGKATTPDGSVYFMTAFSFGNADTTGQPDHNNGVKTVDLSPAPAPAPAVATEAIPAPAPTPTPTTDEAVEVPVKVIPADPNKWQQSFITDGAGEYIARQSVVVKDLANQAAPQQLIRGQKVAVAGRFIGPDGASYWRTKKGVETKTWRGIPLNANNEAVLTEDEDSIFDIFFDTEIKAVETGAVAAMESLEKSFNPINLKDHVLRTTASIDGIIKRTIKRK